MRYREAVAEARRLVKRSEEDQWRLAELTWQQVKEGGVTQTQWAKDVGVSHVYVNRLVKVWETNGCNDVTDRPRFCDAYAEAQGMPLDRSERRLREAASNLAKASVEDRAKVVAEVLSTPEGADVMEKVLDSRDANVAISRASNRVRERQERSTYDRQRDKMPDLIRGGHLADAWRKVRHATHDLREAITEVQAAAAIRSLNVEEQEEITEALVTLDLERDAIRDVVASSGRSLDEQLSDLTKGQ